MLHPDPQARSLPENFLSDPTLIPTTHAHPDNAAAYAQFSLGYFLNDLILILQFPSIGGADMLVHHVIVGIFFTSGLLDRCCTPYHFLFMIEELSTPFLNLRWQYRNARDSTVYVIAQVWCP